MNLSIEFEFAVAEILFTHYPNYRFELTAEITKDFIENESSLIKMYYFVQIDFQGYLIENSFHSKNSSSNPFDTCNRDDRIDFWLYWSGDDLQLCSWWKTAILSLEYTPTYQIWLNEEEKAICSPYPYGSEFEAIAASFYSILQQDFPITFR